MITQEENELLTRTGPGTPCGELMRRYWQPVALSEELPQGSAPLPIKILGEDLVLFRDNQRRAGLLGLHCSHRGTDLSYGRVEDGGLRCIYHGWLYDIQGRCLEQPGELHGGKNNTICHLAYPCKETAGLVFVYMGLGEPPLFPGYEALTAPDEHRAIRKYFQECNYQQGNEGNIDPVHLSYLHRQFLIREGEDQRQGVGVKGSQVSADFLYPKDPAPEVELELTDFGVRIFTVRKIAGNQSYLRVSNFVLPNISAVPAETGGDGYNLNWHVPIDDTHHWKYMITFRRSAPIDRTKFKERNAGHTENFRLIRNRSNRYLQDREEMRNRTFSGMGSLFPVHDAFATESQGSIQDRTQEHLASTDKAILAARKLLLKGIQDVQQRKEAPHVIREPQLNSFPHLQVVSEIIPSGTDIKIHVREIIKNEGVHL